MPKPSSSSKKGIRNSNRGKEGDRPRDTGSRRVNRQGSVSVKKNRELFLRASLISSKPARKGGSKGARGRGGGESEDLAITKEGIDAQRKGASQGEISEPIRGRRCSRYLFGQSAQKSKGETNEGSGRNTTWKSNNPPTPAQFYEASDA